MAIRIRVSAYIQKDEKLLLVNHRKADQSYWLLPGGGVESGETLYQALTRELQEETSLLIQPQELLFVCESISPGGRHVLHICFKALVKAGGLRVNKDERVNDASFFDKEQLADLRIYPNIKDLIVQQMKGECPQPKAKYLGNVWH